MARATIWTSAARLTVIALGLTLATGACAVHQDEAKAAPASSPAAPKPAAAPAAAKSSAKVDLAAGRDLFTNWGCGSCHALSDAGADGHVGPSLDANANLTKAFIVNRVTNGQGPMPSFGGQLTDAEIAQLADYIMAVSAK